MRQARLHRNDGISALLVIIYSVILLQERLLISNRPYPAATEF